MPISIKNPETENLARRLAAMTGETLTEAIRHALEDRYGNIIRKQNASSSILPMAEIAARCAARPLISDLSADDLLGYDEIGAPSR